MKGKKIGLNVPQCFREMANGRVSPANVERVIGETHCLTPENWDEMIKSYKKWQWRGVEDIAEKLLLQFLEEGRVEQPRLTHGMFPVSNTVKWVTSLDQIDWEFPPSDNTLWARFCRLRYNMRKNLAGEKIPKYSA